MDVFIYRHVGDDSIEAVVDPETLDLVGPQSDELLQFLVIANVSIKSLIEMGVFTNEAKVSIASDPDSRKNVLPPMKRIELEELEAAVVSFWLKKNSFSSRV